MTVVVLLVGYGTAVACLGPRLMARAAWTHRTPRVALAVWGALAVSLVLAVVSVLMHLAVPGGWFAGCTREAADALDDPDAAGLRVAVPLLAGAALLGRLGWRTGAAFLGAARARRRHAATLAIVGDTSVRPGLTVLRHEVPAVYCLPGRRPRIVATTGALDALDEPLLAAVIAHERAHLRGRHHVLVALAEGFARAWPSVPLARGLAAATPLLVEMTADDAAARAHGRDVLASALYTVAAGGTPRSALAAHGADVLPRIIRLLHPARPVSRGRRTAVLVLAGMAVLLPLLSACGVA
jgi:Zn-dependent protease with chaperone function